MDSNPEYRQYPISDDKLIVHAGVIKNYFIKHHAVFTEFNSVKFHPMYHEEFDKKIVLAKGTTSDAFILKRQAIETAKVDDARAALQRSLNTVSFVVNDCYMGNQKAVNEFRFSKLSDYSKNPDKFMGFAKDVLVLVEAHKDELTAAGLKESIIAVIHGQIADLDSARRAQIETINLRPGLTKDRKNKMDDIWKSLTDMKNGAHIIFENQPEIRSLFDLPKAPARPGEIEEEETAAPSTDDNSMNI